MGYDPAAPGLRPQEFFGTLTRPAPSLSPVHFTVKFRKKQEAWQWINDLSPQEDGELCFQYSKRIPEDLLAYLQYPADEISISDISNMDCTDTRVWSITASIDPARGGCPSYRTINLGLPNTVLRWFSLVRISRPWLAPRQGKGLFSISEQAIFISFLRCDGLNLMLLAISLDEVLTVFNSNNEGNVLTVARNDDLVRKQITIISAVSTVFDNGIASIMQYARQIAEGTVPMLSEEQCINVEEDSEKNTEAQELEGWEDNFTYCTWNGLGQSLNEDTIMNALESLADHDIKVGNLIVDDGWQSLDDNGTSPFDRRWMNFDADKSRFPNGLKNTVSRIRRAHPWIQNVAVWHGIFGYWGGISPFGDVYKRYKTLDAKREQTGLLGGGSMTIVNAEDAFKFYDDFYR